MCGGIEIDIDVAVAAGVEPVIPGGLAFAEIDIDVFTFNGGADIICSKQNRRR